MDVVKFMSGVRFFIGLEEEIYEEVGYVFLKIWIGVFGFDRRN